MGDREVRMKVLVFISFAAVTSDPNVSVTFNNHLSFWLTLHVCAIGTIALDRCAELQLGSVRLFALKLRLKKQRRKSKSQP